ncbi:MAG: N-6 DNA methylase [Armatimonadetes bacterium]|nr:N-6 DNA methylase [Armatimonadota bacterium]
MANHANDEIARFKETVVDAFTVPDQRGTIRGYSDYLELPATERSDDEADVVDTRFTMRVLEWLGFTEGQYTYNRRQTGRPTNRPDFVAYGAVGTAFVWEDKRTCEAFDSEEHVKQLARYAAGTPGYAVWSNAHRILAVRFDPNGNYITLADVNLSALFGSQVVFPDEMARQQAGLQLFYLLFRRDRFVTFDDLVKAICVTKIEFLDGAVPLASETAQREFIKGAGQVLDHLRIAALSRLHAAIEHRAIVDNRRAELHAEWEQETKTLKEADPVVAKAIRGPLEAVSAKLGDLDDGQIEAVEKAIFAAEKGRMPKVLADILDKWKQRTSRINAAVHAARLLAGSEIYIRDAFIVWKDRQPDPELATLEVFAQQAAYVFFVRILLARTLEDKGLIENRIASDGGFERWREIVTFYFRESDVSIHAHSFIQLLAERVAAYYQHFFHQPVFDWFLPDDYMLVETLEFLSRYNFEDVQSDILGFTYEEYIERVARNKKGHFLTRPNVVEYMLDLAAYEGQDVIGRRVLDPACGSGSFLVSAARRYRKALVSAVAGRAGLDPADLLLREDELRLEVAEKYVEALTTLLYGMDIDPFSCYLAELNLFVCGLEDIHFLWKRRAFTPIERFHIYNTDSLNLPANVLDSSIPQSSLSGERELLREDRAVYSAGALSLADELVDEGHVIKAKADEYSAGFYYVISNPPYITRKQHPGLDSRYRQRPFYAEALSCDMNTYLLFLRLGLYYLADGGVICYIVPLTILGDQSASAIRHLLTDFRVQLGSLVRFYSGNVLFPGVDQATAIVCATAGRDAERPVLVAGGYTVAEAGRSRVERPLRDVVSATPRAAPWHGTWLVSPVGESYRVWEHVQKVASGCLGDLWPEDEFDVRQGDVNATYVKPFQVESPKATDIPLFKGESVFSYAPLPESPAAWARIPASAGAGTSQSGVVKALARIRVSEI